MIEHLEIRNYALIENLSIDFSDGFNVITGETGSGKSIILGALGLLMGEKADVSSIRTGTEEMTISAVLSVPDNHEIVEFLNNLGIEIEDGTVLIRRSVKQNGRGTISIQGQSVTRQELTEVADSLIDMHGQSEHQSLLIPDKQRKILDSYSEDSSLIKDCQDSCRDVQNLEKKLEEVKKQIEEGSRQEDYLRFALTEIEAADIKENEDIELKEKVNVLSSFETIFESLTDCNEKLKQSRSLLHDASLQCQKAAKCDNSLTEYCARLESTSIEAEDLAETFRDYLSSVDYSEETINQMQERLNVLQKLKRKYGPELSDVVEFGKKAKENLEISDNSQAVLENLENQLLLSKNNYFKASLKLTETRKTKASELERKIEQTLRTLGMENAVFSINVSTEKDKISINGSDSITFLISSNPGEPLKPISEIASGGELSRVMLSLKTVLARADSTQTQIFDEVDSGIGGTVAKSLALSITDLSKQKQVIAITHLASIASKAQSQFVVSKNVEGGRTFSHLKEVSGDDRVLEIARMLSGDNDNVSLDHARALLKSE